MPIFTHTLLSLMAFTYIGLPVIRAQVPVSQEPLHRVSIQNKYFRLLDVWLQPGDTSLYHIHALPSLFLYLSKAVIASQIKGQGWVEEQAIPGLAWYRSFMPDSLIHRVCNLDTVPFHVTDIELLSPYDTTGLSKQSPLPLPLLFENDRAFAYRLTSINNGQIIRSRGPMIAELVLGQSLIFCNAASKQPREIKTGQYIYIEPETAFYFSAENKEIIDLVLFELK